ncbi:Microcystin-dependent protein (fragment) [Methylocella tundrae]|uniref:Microcystin-dependent protein n=1 Tax=Methylocella tundrae TaxID=227605 RepID=A0A8B6MCS2_METTU
MRILCFAAAAVAICVSAGSALAGGNPFLGEIDTFPYNFCPVNWAPLNGQLLPINQYQALFSLLGTTFGGDGRTTFALPLAKPVLTLTQGAGLIQCISLTGIYPSRS